MRKVAEIRYRLKMECQEFADLLGFKFRQEVSRYEKKDTIVHPCIAKHILKTVKELGISMTLDEFYEDVKPNPGIQRFKKEDSYKESLVKRDIRENLKRGQEFYDKKEFFKELKELDAKKLAEKSAGVTKVKYDPIVIS